MISITAEEKIKILGVIRTAVQNKTIGTLIIPPVINQEKA
jgi:hypothetical protein